MPRLAIATLLIGLGLIGSRESEAASRDGKWGIGPKIGTFVIPGQYPALPPKIANYNFIDEGEFAGDPEGDEPRRDLGPDSQPRFTTLNRVRDDVQLAVDGWYGIDTLNRIGGGAGVGLGLGQGRGYLEYWITFNYDRVLRTKRPFNVVAGLQAGFGAFQLAADDPDEVYQVRHFPIRARIQGQFMKSKRMFGFGAYVQTAVPSSTIYGDLDGAEQPSVGGPLNFALFTTLGIEAQVMFGDFKKDRPAGKPGNRRNDRPNGRGGKGGRGR